MSRVDVEVYSEIANDALKVLQDIMYNQVSNPTARAIAATALLDYCRAVVRNEKSKKSQKPTTINNTIGVACKEDIDPGIIYETMRKYGINYDEAVKAKGIFY